MFQKIRSVAAVLIVLMLLLSCVPAAFAATTDLTYQEYLKMTTEEQLAFRAEFASSAEFKQWYLAAKQEYEDNQNKVVIGDGNSVDLGELLNPILGSGTCGDALTWELRKDNILTISGSGAMYDYTADTLPWAEYTESITKIVLPDELTGIGDYAFNDCSAVASITIPAGVTEIGSNAFSGCTALEEVIYSGTQAAWQAISIGDNNEPLESATVLYTGEIKLSNAAPTLYDNIAMNYKVNKTRFDALGITDPYLTVSFQGVSTTLTDYSVSEDGSQYIFTFYNIAPNQMDDTLTATLYATYGGSVYEGATLEYSVATYCYRMLSNSAVVNSDAYAELRTLLVDLLHYGAAAQSFTGYEGELVNARLTESQKAWGTTSDPTLEDKTATKYATVDSPTAAWKSVSLVLEDAVTMRFKFTAPSTDGLSLKITSDTNTTGWVIDAADFQYEESTGRYYVDFGGLHAGQMRECVYVTVYSGDTAISNTLRYTVESYAYKYQSADAATYPNLAELVKAMMRYGDAAYNFAN